MATKHKQQVYTKNFFAKDENSEDGKGITIINPTKNSDGTPKYIDQEDLIMYANLMVEQTPRNRVIDGEETRVINIANNRNVNFLNPSSNSNGSLYTKEKLSTDWAQMFYENQPYDSESFGIEEITISNNASMVPEVDITFIDVRGKNLWERANDPNNPYNIFLTFPYPLFYLTVKGYLGEGMSMPLVLKKVNTSFSGEDGHFRTVANFQSWTFAMLNDLLMQYAVLVPYMYEQSDDSEFGYEGMEQLNDIFKRQEQGDNGYTKPNQKISSNGAPLTVVDLIKNVGNVVEEINNKQLASDIIIDKNALKQLQSEFTKLNDEVLDRYSKLANADIDQEGSYKRLASQEDNESLDYSYLYGIIENFKENFQNISEKYYNKILNEIGSNNNGVLFNKNIFKPDIPENDENIVTSDKFIEEMSNIFNNIFVDLNNDLNNDFVNSATNEVTNKLNFEPNIENVLRIFCNNLQAFLELLANKSGKAYNQVLEDTLRQSQQKNNGDYNTKTEEIYPWPEYWLNEGDDGLQKEYPGKYYKDWEEVKFVNELVKARQRVDAVLNVSKDENKIKTEQNFNALPIDHPITERPYQNFGERDLIKEVMQRGSYSIFHEGYLYYSDEESMSNIARNKGKLEAQNLIAVAKDKGDSPSRLSGLQKLLSILKSESTSLEKVREYIIGGNNISDIKESVENGDEINNLLDKPDLYNDLKMETLITYPILFMVNYSHFDDSHVPIVPHNFSTTKNADEFLNNIQQNISFNNDDNVILGLLNLSKYVKSSIFNDGSNDDVFGKISSNYRNWNKPMKDNYRPITNSNSGSNIKNRLFENTYNTNLPDESIYNKELSIEQTKYDNSK